MSMEVCVEGGAPWGFRLAGGRDVSRPLVITQVTPGGRASQAGLCPGDAIVSICGADAAELTHAEAQNKIKTCGAVLTLRINRPETPPTSPALAINGKDRSYPGSPVSPFSPFAGDNYSRPTPRRPVRLSSVDRDSELYKLQEENRRSGQVPKQSGFFHRLQGMLDDSSEGKGSAGEADTQNRHT
uniref:PDZ and LIM domain protein 4-like n=1 Tax=Petromyzon marinus TaxID=7757 RepID=A0AAJ7XBE9_PETMA|nr:PDZ and LIM domain protein 4-like [Petromyzon marinus]